MSSLHPFQRVGLGFAPFKLVSVQRHAGGCCAYCGVVISHRFVVHDCDGVEFGVGSDCVAKVAIDGCCDPQLMRDAKRLASAAERAEWHQRRDAAWAALQDNTLLFKDQPHPHAWRQDKTLRDDILYRFGGYSSQADRRKAIVAVEWAMRALSVNVA